MAIRKAVEHLRRTIGLNNRLDPERLQEGSRENGYAVELADAENISIDDRGLISLRPGSTRLVSGSFSSCFCDGGDCFLVQERTSDSAILRIVSFDPFVTAGVRSSLTKGLRMAWAQTGADTFYSNGTENGYIRAGVSAAWPVNTYRGPDDDRAFMTSIPVASHIAFRQHGQILLAIGSAILANHAPFQFGLFNARSGFVAAFESNVTMVATVRDGFFASDTKKTWFFRQTEEWYNYRQELVEDAPSLPSSLAINRVKLEDAGINAPGFGRVWASTKGVCIGTDDGVLYQRTDEKFVYPSGKVAGACLVTDSDIIHTAS
jgi:hypothetical protein